MQGREMKITEKELGVVVLVLCGFFGMIYPTAARWILLVLILVGLWSWWNRK